MLYSMVPFPVTLSDRYPRFQGHGVIVDALDILCAQLMRDLFAIVKFLFACAIYRVGMLIPGYLDTRVPVWPTLVSTRVP